MIKENKASKYLLYAIGEIILVVIGILIALQINNWNENRKTTSLAKKYILDIKNDLINDTLTFNLGLKRINNSVEKNKVLLNSDLTTDLSIDSLFSLVSTSFHSARIYKINNATYLKLSNTGFLDSGIYSDIFTDINTYYNKEYAAYSEFIEWDEEQSIDIFHPNFLGSYKSILDLSSIGTKEESLSNSKVKKEPVVTLLKFVNSTEFRNKAWTSYRRKENVIGRLIFQKQIATNLIDKIDTELE